MSGNLLRTANTGGGGGGSGSHSSYGGAGAGAAGGSGYVVVVYPSSKKAASVSAGLTYTVDTSSRSGYRIYKFTGGTGTVTW